jgi:hypothetical protein
MQRQQEMGEPMRTHTHTHTHTYTYTYTHTHTHTHIHIHGNQSCWEKFRRADASPESYLLSETRFAYMNTGNDSHVKFTDTIS